MPTESSNGRRIPWLRIGAESVAIVVSILIAFAIDAWWDDRQDRAYEHEALAGLEQEFARLEDVLSRGAARYDTMKVLIEWLLDDAALEADATIEQFDEAVGPMVGAPTADPSSAVRDSLIASGRLAVIGNDELRSRLAGWQRVVDETMDNEATVRAYAGNVTVPFLAARGVPIGRSFATWRGEDWGLALAQEADSLARYRRLAGDLEFRTLATWRYDWAVGSAEDFRRAQAEARAILELVRRELAR